MPVSTDSDDVPSQSESEGSESTLRGESDSENESDPGAGNRGGGFFDLEAADIDDETSESEESDASSEADAEPLFPRFIYLPAELRRRVWEFFCPEVLGVPRILEFVWDMAVKEQPVLEGSSTANATEPARTLAAVDRETRGIALRAFPHILELSDGRGDVRLDTLRDIVMLQNIRHFDTDRKFHLAAGFSNKVENLAIDLDRLSDMPFNMVNSLRTAFPKLLILYPCLERPEELDFETEWINSDNVNRYTLRTVDDTAGLMRQEEREFVWPDLVNHEDFADTRVGPEYIRLGQIWPPRDDDGGLTDFPAEVWPIIELTRVDSSSDFDQEDGFAGEDTFDVPEDLDGYETDEIGMYTNSFAHTPGETDSDEDLDQYEDDFVVEDGIVEYDEDDSDSHVCLSGFDSDGVEISGHREVCSERNHPDAYAVDPPAEFSDLEPESDEGTGEEGGHGSESGDGSEGGDVREVPVRSRPRRAVISDDEDEDEEKEEEEKEEEEEEASQVRARSQTHRTVVSEDDEDDDEDARQPSAGRRGRPVVISDDDDEDEDARQAPTRRRARRAVVSEDEDEDE